MARFRKPFFRPARGTWYVWHEGKQVKLGTEKGAAFATCNLGTASETGRLESCRGG